MYSVCIHTYVFVYTFLWIYIHMHTHTHPYTYHARAYKNSQRMLTGTHIFYVSKWFSFSEARPDNAVIDEVMG